MSDMKSHVKVHSKLTVVSSKPIGSGKTHRLLAVDHAMGLHTLHLVFYYQVNPFENGPFDLVLDSIGASLSELLSMYPPVTGRLARGEDGNWEVKCNDAGVRMLRASVGTSLDEWLRSANASDERQLTVWEDLPDDPHIWSPFRIQINDFEGGGLAIGLSCTHMIADPTCATLLFKSWTDVHRGGKSIAHSPLFHLPALSGRVSTNANTKSTEYYATKSKIENTTTTPMKMATATFRFSNSVMKQCLSEIHDEYCPDATPFDFLAALFWIRVMRLKPPKHDHTHSLSICVDSRKLMHVSIPHGCFGNALYFSFLSLDADELDSGVLGHVAGMVHRHVAGLKEEEVGSVIDWFESRKGESGKYEPPFKMYGPELTCLSMEDMINPGGTKDCANDQSLMYAAMFKKNEKPVHVTYHVGNVEGDGLILVTASPEEGHARTVTVTLPEEQIAKLCEDQAILDLQPTMLITGRK